MTATRRLAAILAADVAGYSRLMGEDEEGTLAALKAIRRELGDPKVKEHRGRIVKTTGDGLLIEFASVVDAVRCAVEVQQAMAARNAAVPAAQRLEFRMGINLGDIIRDGRDIFGDGVNVAARLEALAEPGGVCISGVVHDQVQDKLDLAFEDMGEQQVKNIARPVHVWHLRLGAKATAPQAPALALPDKPSIAVLPFQNMSGDQEQDYFADGMVEEIITALSRIRWLFVIARNSSFTYKGKAVDVKRVGRELGVRYVLEGSVRKGGGRVRITAQLIEAETGTHLWADRFDGSFEDVFDLQDRVATSVAGVIEPTLQVAESHRAANRPTTDLGAYDLYLRALPVMFRLTKEDLTEAANLLDRAIERDPRYGPALAFASICHMHLAREGRTDDPEVSETRAVALARRALQVAHNDPVTLANGAYALASFGEDIAQMIAVVDRALALNPSYARGWYASGFLNLIAGNAETAVDHVEKSLRLSPRDYVGVPLIIIGSAHFLARRFELAIENLSSVVRQIPAFPATYRLLAACYAHLGRLDEARAAISQLRSIGAAVMPDSNIGPLANAEYRRLLLSGLRLAMGEDT
jgi:TolB-like protein/Tfp pilus assembly protein PilF